ncbi:MAG: hypothetical protein M3044_16285 [Thermoproteota archaeon]|nr:hypothetical protein [Thermoproteota archaeon]
MKQRQLHPHRLQKVGGGSTNNSTSPIGSSTFLKVITIVDNTKGGTKKPSDFTIMVSGKSPSPKSFSGSSSGTSVTLSAGKFKVTGVGPTGYNIAYSSGCSGTASGGSPIKYTTSPSFSLISSPTNGFVCIILAISGLVGGWLLKRQTRFRPFLFLK